MQYQQPILIQEQRLKLSPQMYQSIKLMALPIAELNMRIKEEIEKNPALEIVSEKSTISLEEAQSEQIERRDAAEYFENSSDPGYITTSSRINSDASDMKQQFIEGVLSRPETLQDALLFQLRVQKITEKEREIGETLIYNLNSNGFYVEDPEILMPHEKKETLKKMVSLIRGFEPAGSCTRDYRESILVQIQLDQDADLRLCELVEKHFDKLEKKKYREICKSMKISAERLQKLIEGIKKYNPFPGSKYSQDEVRYVVPDIMVKEVEGEFVIILNDEEIPVLGINSFFNKLSNGKDNDEANQFVKGNIQDAKWFIKSIKQRNDTLLKITSALVDFQRNFFLKGPKYLAPLTLKDVAETVSVHETTVSRISNAKYIQTEWGLLPLKYFFSNSVSGASSNGTNYSKNGVKEILKEVIEENAGEKRLSDQKLSNLLKEKGVNIARRTVAKYRKELDINSSYTR